MNSSLLRGYELLPRWLRSPVGSIYGYHLRRQRYGLESDALVAKALERETWSAEQWRAWQTDKLTRLLYRAATAVPYYRDWWSSRRRKGDRASWEDLANWPVLEKESLRQNPRAFVAEDSNARRLGRVETSGTTGTPVTLWRSRATVRGWYAIAEARWRRWHGVSRHDRWAIVGGKQVVPLRQNKPPFWIWNVASKQLYISAYHISPATAPAILDAMRRYRIRYLMGYTTSLTALSQSLLDHSERIPLAVVLTNGEPLYDYQRAALQEAFGCPARESYAMNELCAAASECEHGQLHLWPEAGWLEALAPFSGETGDLVCTGLLNADMPLIRYRVGDRGALAQQNSCRCGRSLPQLKSLEGRTDDTLLSSDGRILSSCAVEIIFDGIPHLREAQIIQRALDHFEIRYVPALGFDPSTADLLVRSLKQRIGPGQVSLQRMERIPRGPNGKFRVVMSEVSSQEAGQPAIRRPP